MSDNIDSANLDSFAQVIVAIFNSTRCMLPFIRYVIELEFASVTKHSQGAVLRGNNIVSKIEGNYVRILSHKEREPVYPSQN